MSVRDPAFSHMGFVKAFVLPGLLIFLIPIVSLAFFIHAQSRVDAEAREAILKQIGEDPRLSSEQREKARAFFTAVPVSRLMTNAEFAQQFDRMVRFQFATFRWMIFLSAASILVGVAVFLLAGLCVVLSLTSQFVQYHSLRVSWHALRIYGALQALVQGILLVALSFWVTALWFHFYSIKLILVAGCLALGAVGIVIVAIFRRIKQDFVVEGQVIEKDESAPIWTELRRICDRVGTELPDQLIAGIDDNFFVTEQPVTVDDAGFIATSFPGFADLMRGLGGDLVG